LALKGDEFIGRRILIANEPGLNLSPDATVLIYCAHRGRPVSLLAARPPRRASRSDGGAAV